MKTMLHKDRVSTPSDVQNGHKKSYQWSTAHSFSFVFSLLNVDCSRVSDLAHGRADIFASL